MEQAILIPIEKIVDNPYQHREQENPADVQEIAISIAQHGLQQYPAVRAVNSHYELIFGHTRTAAYRLLATSGVPTAEIKADKQYAQIPAYVRELTDKQMFEMAIVENLKRRDPKPTEKAKAIQKYMTEFSATSKEAGELFGMNDATARGMVRLLDLPIAVQQKLDDGTITQGTARTLLSVQKLVPGTTMQKIMAEIEKGQDEDGDPVEPATIIANEVRWAKNTEDMWAENRRDGKPRSNWQNGWLLDMKNFPNKLLTALTYKEVIEAIGAEDDAQLKALVNEHLSFHDLHKALQEINHPAAAIITHLLEPTACNACPFYSVVYGTHYCGLKACWTRKTAAWQVQILQAASRDLGIAIYETKDGKYDALESYEGADKRLFENGNADLRLIPIKAIRGYVNQSFKGVNTSVFAVVLTGKTLAKRLVDTRAANKTSPEISQAVKISVRREELRKEKTEALKWEAVRSLKVIFDAMKLEALRILFETASQMFHDDWFPAAMELPENTDAEMADVLRHKIAWIMLNEAITWKQISEWKTVSQTAESLVTLGKNWGVKLPAKFSKMAEQFDMEIKAVAVETKQAKK